VRDSLAAAGRRSRAVLALWLFVSFAACGVVSAPIPPEDVGLAAALEKGKQKERAKAAAAEAKAKEEAPPEEEGADLLPLRPVGTPP